MSPTLEERLQQYRAVLDEAAAELNSRPKTPGSDDDNVVPLLPRPSRKRVLAVAAVAAALITGAVGVVAWRLTSEQSEAPATQPSTTIAPTTSSRPTAAEVVSPARRFEPFLLLDGWQIASYLLPGDAGDVPAGTVRELTFEKDEDQMYVIWYTDDLESRMHEWETSYWKGEHDLHGRPAHIYQPTQTRSELVAVWRDGEATLEIRDNGTLQGDRQRFLDLLDAMREVDRDEFEAALPAGSLDDSSAGPRSSGSVPIATTQPTPAAAVTPYLLMDGWTATGLETFDDWQGADRQDVRMLTFGRAGRSVRAFWTAGVDDGQVPGEPENQQIVATPEILGHRAEIVRTSRGRVAFTATWNDGDVTIEITTEGGESGTIDEFLGALDDLRAVTAEEFAAAMVAEAGTTAPANPGSDATGSTAHDLQPFVLIDGWELIELSEYDEWDGVAPGTAREATYQRDERTIDVFWYAYDNHVDKLRDRVNSAYEVSRRTVLGHPAQITHYGPTPDEFSALWRDGNVTMEVTSGDRETFADVAEFTEVLNSMRLVDRADFEAAVSTTDAADESSPTASTAS